MGHNEHRYPLGGLGGGGAGGAGIDEDEAGLGTASLHLMGSLKKTKKKTGTPGDAGSGLGGGGAGQSNGRNSPPGAKQREKPLDAAAAATADAKGTGGGRKERPLSATFSKLVGGRGGGKGRDSGGKGRDSGGKGRNSGDGGGLRREEGGEGEEEEPPELFDAGEIDGTADIPEEYRDAKGNFKMMPVPRHLGSLTRRRPPLVAIVGVAGCGKSRLASALFGRGKERQCRAEFGVGRKTVEPKVVVGEDLSVLDTPGLPDPRPRNSDTYYNDTVVKLRSVGYANAILFLVNQERVTPTLIKNYGLLYRALNRLDCVKMFVLRRETSYLLLNKSDQEAHERESRRTVNQILQAANLKKWGTKQFFMLTAGSGEEQDKQIKAMRAQVKKSPKVEISASEGLRLTTEVKSEDLPGEGCKDSDDGEARPVSAKRNSTSKNNSPNGSGNNNNNSNSSSKSKSSSITTSITTTNNSNSISKKGKGMVDNKRASNKRESWEGGLPASTSSSSSSLSSSKEKRKADKPAGKSGGCSIM